MTQVNLVKINHRVIHNLQELIIVSSYVESIVPIGAMLNVWFLDPQTAGSNLVGHRHGYELFREKAHKKRRFISKSNKKYVKID